QPAGSAARNGAHGGLDAGALQTAREYRDRVHADRMGLAAICRCGGLRPRRSGNRCVPSRAESRSAETGTDSPRRVLVALSLNHILEGKIRVTRVDQESLQIKAKEFVVITSASGFDK